MNLFKKIQDFRGSANAATSASTMSDLSWEADIVLNSRKSERTAWRVATGSLIVVLLMVICLALLIPLKQIVPYVITVDKLTGESNTTTTAKEFVSTTALTDKHWLKKFLISRERYNFRLLQYDYDTVKLLAGDRTWLPYAKLFDGDDGMDKKYGESTEIIPTILSMTTNGNGLATIRYELKTKDFRNTADPVVTRRIATIRYAYVIQPTKKEFELVDNPLGFQALGYQTDPEFVTPTASLGVPK